MLVRIFLFLLSFSVFFQAYSISIYEHNLNNFYENDANQIHYGTDQGSIAKNKWDQFEKTIFYYDQYKKNLNKVNKKFEEILIYNYLNSIKNKMSEYYTSLVFLERYNPDYFKYLYLEKNPDQVYYEKIKELEPVFLTIINIAAHSLIKMYAKEFPVLIYEVDFRSWIKAYWGTLNSEHKWGFEPAHYYNKSIDPIYKSEIFNFFVQETLNNESDLNSIEVFFSVNWANANLSPLTNKIEKKLQYRLVEVKNIDLLKKYFNLNPQINKKYIKLIKTEKKYNLLIKNIKEINNYFVNIIKKIDNINFNGVERKFVQIVDPVSNKCLNIYNKVQKNVNNSSKLLYGHDVSWEKCVNNESQKWYVINSAKNLNKLKIFSAFRKGYCLEESAIFGVSLTLCNSKLWRQNWFIQNDKSIINQKTGHKVFDNIKIQENLSFSLASMIDIPFNENFIVNDFEPFLNRFFEMVDDHDVRLQILNENRLPSYRLVWNKWSNNEWNPPEEFNHIVRQTAFLRQGLTEEQFSNVFQNIQDLSLSDAIVDDAAELDVNESFEYFSRPYSPSLPPYYQEEGELSFWDSSFDTESTGTTNSTAELQEELRAFDINSESENMLQNGNYLSEIQDLSQIFDDIESSSNLLNSNIQILLQTVTTLSSIGNFAFAATVVTLIP
ncbi:MAG: hypothetical protein DCC88_07315 [Spirobacillus cienkowskii]|jgi:hypothetical protein|uniref:Uncharacterized protein n=1 Tax=Spirobacillus cienkowskii TaxID=495820 RepID=A0A369KMY6_9BACT|nr:MAG: hypothetical protein DCC88_07315 [Spirobacillus cienkowskii]